MKRLFPSLVFALFLALPAAAQKPRLIINIVVSQMRYDYLQRFGAGFSDGGFRRMIEQGTLFTDAHYTFAQTTTPAALASLVTGAYPEIHGIVASRWIDYTTNREVDLIADPRYAGLDCDAGLGKYSPSNLMVPTVGDKLMGANKNSKVVSLAIDPLSAIVMGGGSKEVYWMDRTRATWISSTAYKNTLPQWVARYNDSRPGEIYLDYHWAPLRRLDSYVNTKQIGRAHV